MVDDNLLQFCKAHGLHPDYGCRSGQCSSCTVPLLKGKVSYKQPNSAELEANEILLYCAVPATDPEHKIVQLEIGL